MIKALPVILCLSFAATLATAASAQTRVVTYDFDQIWFNSSSQMTGTFEWTYQVGDFENGTAQFLDIYVPGYGSDINNLVFTVDMDSIEITLNGSYHGMGVDVFIRMLSDLDPVLPAFVDPANSTYDIENVMQGNMLGGSVVPLTPDFSMTVGGTCPSIQLDIEGASAGGQVALLYAFGQGSFTVPGGPCVGTVLGLDNTTSLAVMLQADASGTIAWNANVPAGACGTVYLQSLDLGSCATSDVIPLL